MGYTQKCVHTIAPAGESKTPIRQLINPLVSTDLNKWFINFNFQTALLLRFPPLAGAGGGSPQHLTAFRSNNEQPTTNY